MLTRHKLVFFSHKLKSIIEISPRREGKSLVMWFISCALLICIFLANCRRVITDNVKASEIRRKREKPTKNVLIKQFSTLFAHFQSDQRGNLGSVSILINGYASVPRIRNVLFYSRTRCQIFIFQEFQRVLWHRAARRHSTGSGSRFSLS